MSAPHFAAFAARKVAPARLPVAVGLGGLLSCLLLFAWYLRTGGPTGVILGFGIPGLLLTVASLLFLLLPWRLPRRVAGSLRVGERALLWDGEPVFARSEVTEAIAYTNLGKCGVRVRAKRRTAWFELDTLEEADRIVAALGQDTNHAAVSVSGSAIGIGALVTSLVWFAAPIPDEMRVAFALVLGLLPVTLDRFDHARWVVGSDGLSVQRGFRAPRFVRYADIAKVQVSSGDLLVTPTSGDDLELKLPNDDAQWKRPVVGARALARRIEEGRRRATASEDDVTVGLGRGGRPVGEWIAELRGLVDRPATYRVAAVPRDRLWSAVEDATQPAEVRAAAATALGGRLADDERPRLRIAAAACASAELRAALEAAEDGDEARLGEALTALGAGERRARHGVG